MNPFKVRARIVGEQKTNIISSDLTIQDQPHKVTRAAGLGGGVFLSLYVGLQYNELVAGHAWRGVISYVAQSSCYEAALFICFIAKRIV